MIKKVTDELKRKPTPAEVEKFFKDVAMENGCKSDDPTTVTAWVQKHSGEVTTDMVAAHKE